MKRTLFFSLLALVLLSSELFSYDPATSAEETILSWDTLDTDAPKSR